MSRQCVTRQVPEQYVVWQCDYCKEAESRPEFSDVEGPEGWVSCMRIRSGAWDESLIDCCPNCSGRLIDVVLTFLRGVKP